MKDEDLAVLVQAEHARVAALSSTVVELCFGKPSEGWDGQCCTT